MILLKYSPTKLYTATFLAGLCTLFFLWLFLHPHEVEHVRRARIFATSIGHGLLAPGLFLACLAATINLVMLASGDLAAIKVVNDGLRVRTFWKVNHIRWSQLLRIGVERKQYRNSVSHYLTFDLADGGVGHQVKLNIQHTEVEPHALPGVIDDIQGQWAGGKGRAASGAADADDFDADAALARYMARRGDGAAAPAEAAAPIPAAVRPAFGRKGL